MGIFFNSSVKFKSLPKTKLKQWLTAVANSEKKKIKNLSYNFCTDEELLQINRQFLNHNTYTDIITFDYCEENLIIGEVYISIERVAENAQKLNLSFKEELLRVIAHGLLHLSGYKDKSPSHQKQMRAAENRAITLFTS